MCDGDIGWQTVTADMGGKKPAAFHYHYIFEGDAILFIISLEFRCNSVALGLTASCLGDLTQTRHYLVLHCNDLKIKKTQGLF